MTPEAYFKRHPDACHGALRFCKQFETMRKAWLSPHASVEHMLWGMGRHQANLERLRTFATWCADQAELYLKQAGTHRHWAVMTHKYADATKTEIFAADVQSSAALAASYAVDTAAGLCGDVNAAQQAKLRELFPRAFVGRKKVAK